MRISTFSNLALCAALTGCGAAAPELAESQSELPARGTWMRYGQAIIEAQEGPPAPALDVDPGPRVESEETDRALGESLSPEADRPVVVTSSGEMFERIDRVDRLFEGLELSQHFFEGEEAPGDELTDTRDKDIHGADNRTLWRNTTSYPKRAHVAIRSSSSATRAFCSGVMVGPRHVLSAGHCFHKDGAFTKVRSNLRVVFGQDGSGNSSSNTPLGKRRVVSWVFPKGWLDDGNYKYDYALLILEDSTYSPGWLGMAAYGWTTLQGLGINTNGYPGHHYDCAASPITSGSDKGKCGGYLYHGYGDIDLVFSGTLYTKVDWEKGQSGSPVYRYNNGQRRVVGVVSRSNSSWNKATRMRQGMFDALCDWIGDFPSSNFSHDCD